MATESIVFVVDVDAETGQEAVKGSSRLDIIKQCIIFMATMKKKVNPNHKFGLALLKDVPYWALPGRCTASLAELTSALNRQLQPAAQRYGSFDLGTLVQLAAGLPEERVRLVLMYSRSNVVPQWSTNLSSGVAIDAVYVHEKPQEGVNSPQQVYDALEELVDRLASAAGHHSYIFEASFNNFKKMCSLMVFLLSHPAQRKPQQQLKLSPPDLSTTPYLPLPGSSTTSTSTTTAASTPNSTIASSSATSAPVAATSTASVMAPSSTPQPPVLPVSVGAPQVPAGAGLPQAPASVHGSVGPGPGYSSLAPIPQQPTHLPVPGQAAAAPLGMAASEPLLPASYHASPPLQPPVLGMPMHVAQAGTAAQQQYPASWQQQQQQQSHVAGPAYIQAMSGPQTVAYTVQGHVAPPYPGGDAQALGAPQQLNLNNRNQYAGAQPGGYSPPPGALPQQGI